MLTVSLLTLLSADVYSVSPLANLQTSVISSAIWKMCVRMGSYELVNTTKGNTDCEMCADDHQDLGKFTDPRVIFTLLTYRDRARLS